MLFSEVAAVFDQLEDISGRLEMTDILAELFQQAEADDIGKLIYLIQGIVAPPYEGIDIGIGERFALEAIAAASGYSKARVESHYKKSGDLGDTAEELLQKRAQTALLTSEMDLEHVYSGMVKIAKASGPGSQEYKIKHLTELLNNASPLEARFLVRFVLGRLRLGVGDPTILDAVSVAHAGDKSFREKLERAYNICADMGHVAEEFYKDPELIEKFKVQPFRPLMPALAERLSTPSEIIDKTGKCGVEMKYDGFRLQCHKKGDRIRLYSRKLEDMTRMFPDVAGSIREMEAKEIIFEGEALAFNEEKKRFFSFQQTMHRRRKHGIDKASQEFPLKVFAFDVLYLDGKDLTQKSYRERRKLVEKTFRKKGLIQPSGFRLVSRPEELKQMFDKAASSGLEGIMAKDLDAPYTAGKRKFAWIKLKKSYGKSVDTIDGVIVGYYLGHGARAEFEFGGVLVSVYNSDSGTLETVAKVATGFTEEEMVDLRKMLEKTKTKNPADNLVFNIEVDYWVEPRYVIEVAFDEITKSSMHTCGTRHGKGYALRFPRIVKLREDKTAREVTTTSEVADMYRLQHSSGFR
ncbi:ATP-dependent DNA ligase [Candidatus Micrarchaeota archaeon]|nr:ATP-dependent DNA ligase [Candidatus Micrarchaeota archaeon]